MNVRFALILKNNARLTLAGVAVVSGLSWLATGSAPLVNRALAENQPAATEPAPVEEDMHEFMEYVFQPTYLRLKQAMASEPQENAGWKAIKSDSLILAEGGNLLLHRMPKDDAQAWGDESAAVRDLGGDLYRAAKMKDYPAARKSYEKMLVRCNACHDTFAHGEHQLAP
jgi:hypothetical protein